MHQREIEVVRRFKALAARRVKLHEVIVFGSRARGDATPESDLDLLVVVERRDSEAERQVSDCAWEARFEAGIVIVPIVFSKHELETALNAPPSLCAP